MELIVFTKSTKKAVHLARSTFIITRYYLKTLQHGLDFSLVKTSTYYWHVQEILHNIYYTIKELYTYAITIKTKEWKKK